MDPEDSFYGSKGQTCTNIVRSAASPICQFGPREQENRISSFIDASTLYVSSFNETMETYGFYGYFQTADPGRLPLSWIDDGRPLPFRSVDLNDGCNAPEEVEKRKFCFKGGKDIVWA